MTIRSFLARTALAAITLLLGAEISRSESLSTSFAAANKLYEEGKFPEAVSGYEGILNSGRVSAALYFNLGNAFYKSGQIGRAIAAYRNAADLSPRDPDVQANLKFARNQVQGASVAQAAWQRWLATLTLNEWTMAASASVWLPLVLLTTGQWRPAWRPLLRPYLIIMGIAAALLCACFATDLYARRSIETAIVTTGDAVIRRAPLSESTGVFTAHDGAELRVLDVNKDWFQVSAGGRNLGWIQRDQVTVWCGL
jgi:tetratricopeptide (TPR) repeat protein